MKNTRWTVVSSGYTDLLRTLAVRRVGPGRFVGPPPIVHWDRPYGGLLVAQAVMAAASSVRPELSARSLHAYFLDAGDGAAASQIDVIERRASRSYAWLDVEISQSGRTLLVCQAMFGVDTRGVGHQAAMPPAPEPDELTSLSSVLPEHPEITCHWNGDAAFDLRYVTPHPRFATVPADPADTGSSRVWLGLRGPLPKHHTLRTGVLVYASDLCMLDASLVPHGWWLGAGSAEGLTLNHSIWFHEPTAATEWLLLDQQSPAMAGGRALCTGNIFSADGRLLCTVAQLGTVRQRLTS